MEGEPSGSIDRYFITWQRGSNENTNRLLRQYFPKGTDLAQQSQAKLNAVARQLNERLRKTLDYERTVRCMCCSHPLKSPTHCRHYLSSRFKTSKRSLIC